MQSVYTPPSTGDHLCMSILCLRETRHMLFLVNRREREKRRYIKEEKKVDAAKGVTELAETSSSVFL